MRDIIGDDARQWQRIDTAIRPLLHAYGYQEWLTPIVEHAALFTRSLGQVTDVVEKEMYVFTDQGDDTLSLRPEMTAGLVRAFISSGLARGGIHRLFQIGAAFRRERPQKGRYRQFYQIDIELFGSAEAEADVELIALTNDYWRILGLSPALHLNTLAQPAARARYKTALAEYFRANYDGLDVDSQRRLDTNPLRILDSKNPALRPIIAGAPLLREYADDASLVHFDRVCSHLRALDIEYRVDPYLVRGLDYYNRTIFEWISDDLGAQATICGGGRYDGLCQLLGGPDAPAVGCAIGIDRLLLLLTDAPSPVTDVYICALDAAASERQLLLASALRERGVVTQCHFGSGDGTSSSLRKQLKKAAGIGARFVAIIGEEEMTHNTITLKALLDDTSQQSLAFADAVHWLATQCHRV